MTAQKSPAQAAPRGLRAAAFLLDALLALLAAVTARYLIQLGQLPKFGAWAMGEETPLVEPQLTIVALVLLALRDVPGGASAGKWLLCMRVARSDGRGLGIAARLLRATYCLLPIAVLPHSVEAIFPWRVVAYSPERAGLLLRSTIAAAAVTFSIAWAVESVRPSIGEKDTLRLAASLTESDPLLARQLGGPLRYRILEITRRADQAERGKRASFQLRIDGKLGFQSMSVHALKVNRQWHLDELHDIETFMAPADSERVAKR